MKFALIVDKKLLLFILVSTLFAFGCGKKEEKAAGDKAKGATGLPAGLTPEEAAKVVAKVGDQTITVGDVTEQINKLSPYIRRRWAAPEKRKEFLDKLIRAELLAQEAERLGLQNDPEVQRTVKQVMIRLMIKNDLEKSLFPNQIDEKELKADYDKDHDKYFRPEQVRASQIVVKSEAEAKKMLQELKANAGDPKVFREKARTASMDKETAERGGDIGYFSKPDKRRDDEPVVPPAVAEAAFKLKNVGDLSDEIIKTEKGFHIVKLTNKRAEMNRSFDSVKRMIENRLLREKRSEAMDKFIKDLRTKAKIEVFDENLAKLDVKEDNAMPSPAPPLMINPLTKGQPVITEANNSGKQLPVKANGTK